MVYCNVVDIIEGFDDVVWQWYGQVNSWQLLVGIGFKIVKVIVQVWFGCELDLLVELCVDVEDFGGGVICVVLCGDLYLYLNWLDGFVLIEEMMVIVVVLGYQYCVLIDYLLWLMIVNGLFLDWLCKQLDVIDELCEKFVLLCILIGIEVDIFEDGSLDQEFEMLDCFDIVVVSVYFKLLMDLVVMM